MIDINSKSNEIFNTIKKYVNYNNNNKYNVEVSKRELLDTYPIICFENRSNTLTSHSKDFNSLEKIRSLSFEISILAVDDTKKQISSIEICEYYENIIAYVMETLYHFQGGTDGKLYNINDKNATKFVMHYMCDWFVAKNITY